MHPNDLHALDERVDGYITLMHTSIYSATATTSLIFNLTSITHYTYYHKHYTVIGRDDAYLGEQFISSVCVCVDETTCVRGWRRR